MSGLLFGLPAAFTAAALYSAAIGLQAFEARRVPAAHSLRLSLLTHLARRPLWVAGTVLGVLGWGVQAIALAYAPLTVVEPVLATSLVFLLAVGAYALGERVGRREVFGALAVTAGVAGISWAAPAHSPKHAGGAVLVLALLALGAVVIAPYVLPAGRESPWLLAAGSGFGFAYVGLTTKFAADDFSTTAWGTLAIWIAGIAVVSALGTLSEMSALQIWPVTQVAPIVFLLNVLVPVLLSPPLGGESWSRSTGAGSVLLVSLAAVGAGVAALSRSRAVGALLAPEAAGP